MMKALARLGSDDRGAVAMTVALSLVGLIAVGGLAVDYARLESLDTELQQAADQAALAGVTQLDQQTGAIARATAAAQGLITNNSLFANGAGRKVNIPSITFYASKADAEAANGLECPTTGAVTDDATAKFICVRTAQRASNYALTPIVGLLNSGDLSAMAVAGLGSAICKTPPLMLCNPDEPIGNTNTTLAFNANGYAGRGMKLLGDGAYAPGNFGFLQTGFGSGANALLKALGYNSPPGQCLETNGVTTETGVNASVMDGLNTRFDVNANGNSCPGGDVNCSPSVNVLKDLARKDQCGITGNGWDENDANATNFQSRRYKPTSDSFYPNTLTPEVMGLPRDRCHAWGDAGNCTTGAGRIGGGNWDIDAYWRANHGAASGSGYPTALNSAIATASGIPIPAGRSYPTRYQVYMWEIADYANRLRAPHAASGGANAYDRPVATKCLATATSPYGLVPGGTTVDRRRISAAVLNCQALGIKGHAEDQSVVKWVDLFMVEPSYNRTKCKGGAGGCSDKYSDIKDLYVEIIGETSSGKAGTTAGQVVRRDTPYLIK